jgi:hypothetical protein
LREIRRFLGEMEREAREEMRTRGRPPEKGDD